MARRKVEIKKHISEKEEAESLEVVETAKLHMIVEHMMMVMLSLELNVEMVEHMMETLHTMEKSKVELVEHPTVAKLIQEKSKVELVEPNKQGRTKKMEK